MAGNYPPDADAVFDSARRAVDLPEPDGEQAYWTAVCEELVERRDEIDDVLADGSRRDRVLYRFRRDPLSTLQIPGTAAVGAFMGSEAATYAPHLTDAAVNGDDAWALAFGIPAVAAAGVCYLVGKEEWAQYRGLEGERDAYQEAIDRLGKDVPALR